MSRYHLAQINIGRLVAPKGDPRVEGFFSQLDPVNAIADASPGFVWRLQSDSGNATDIPFSDDPTMLVNMSVWESVETLRDFVYQTAHMPVLRDRAKWFEKLPYPIACLWWVRAGHIPSVQEGATRLEHFQKHGATAEAFWFSRIFSPPD